MDELEAVHQTMHRLEQRWLPPLPDARVWFGYDPLPVALFFRGLREAEPHVRGWRFLDLGCGIGTKLALMHSLGWQVAGVDHHQPYVDVARELVPEADIVCTDLRHIDFFDADLVYMYRPAVSDTLEETLERYVLDRVAPGTVVFFPTRPPEVRVR